MTITINGTTGITTPELTLDNTAADGGQVVLKSSGYSNWNIDNYSGRLRGYYGSTEYWTVDASGNVGIGTSSPSYKLDVVGQNRVTMGGSPFAILMRYDSSSAPFIIGSPSANAMSFSNSDGTERARIDSSGNLLVGTTSADNTAAAGARMYSNGAIAATRTGSTNADTNMIVYSTGAGTNRFYVGMGGTVFATSTSISAISDQTLKTNVRNLETGLIEVLALKPRRFDWINGDAENVAGFIAQEVEEVLPELVSDYQYSENVTKKSLKMGDILPTLVKAIQEQQAIIESLKTRIETLENK